jgi:hypothetical protein
MATTAAATAPKEKVIMKKEKLDYEKEIKSLKKVMSDYKVDRKANWKSFKNKMNEDIDKLKKSLGRSNKKNKK